MVLVSRVQSMHMCADGAWAEVSAGRALWQLDVAAREILGELRNWVAQIRASSSPLRDVDDHTLLALVRRAIRQGNVVALTGHAASATNATAILRRLVGRIDSETRGRLSYQGQRYRLVADVDLNTVPDRDLYQVVGQVEARSVLDGLAQQTAGVAGLLRQASAKLSKDWRAPYDEPEGLVLLRRVPAAAGSKDHDGPAITPSQMKALLESRDREKGPLWIRIDMAPKVAKQANAKFVLTSSDSSIVITKTVKDDLDPGNDTIDLLFDNLWKDLSYSLRVEETSDVVETLFEGVAYADLAALLGANDDSEATQESDDPDMIEAVRSSNHADDRSDDEPGDPA